MGRAPCCDKTKVKKGPWSPEEDAKLRDYMNTYASVGNWIALPQKAGLKRCGKSCRLRWLNYLRPNIKHGEFSDEEDSLILTLFSTIGSRWSIIAAQLPGRTDNDIKNYWNTKLKKKLIVMSNNNHQKQPQFMPQRIKPNTPYQQLLLSPSVSSTSQYTPTPPNNYYNALSSTTLSFNGFDQSTSLLTHSPNGLLQSSYLVFGGAPEPSCTTSSSDGSYKCVANSGENEQGISFQKGNTYFYKGSSSLVEEDHDYKSCVKIGDSVIWEATPPNPVDYDGLEEIKQLISSTTTTTSNGFYFDENKTGEMAMLYY